MAICYNWSPTQRWCGRVTSTPHPTGKGLPMHSSNDTTRDLSCSVDGCERPRHCRGWCRVHYARWFKTGSPRESEPVKPRGRSDAERLWSRVDRSGGMDACWPWTGVIVRRYGQIRRSDGRKERTHRLAWELVHGPIPPGMMVCHHCDNTLCCNAYKCLFLGTHADNMADAARKGRKQGERNGRAILRSGQIPEIRRRIRAGGMTKAALALEYGVGPSAISRLALGKTWGHVQEG